MLQYVKCLLVLCDESQIGVIIAHRRYEHVQHELQSSLHFFVFQDTHRGGRRGENALQVLQHTLGEARDVGPWHPFGLLTSAGLMCLSFVQFITHECTGKLTELDVGVVVLLRQRFAVGIAQVQCFQVLSGAVERAAKILKVLAQCGDFDWNRHGRSGLRVRKTFEQRTCFGIFGRLFEVL